jgi:hypothetical protein
LTVVFALLGVAAVLNGCIIKYSFTGANIHPNAQTFSVAYFNNNAVNVAGILSNTFTEALKDRLQRQTRLGPTSENGDLHFEGEIMDYVLSPAQISAGTEQASMMRLTITVNVRFTNVLEPEWSFPPNGRSFSAYADYDALEQFQAVENRLITEIVETLVDNIFNASVANW